MKIENEKPCTIDSVIDCFDTEITKEDAVKLIAYLEKLTEGVEELLNKYRK
jgi:hypothetical protein